MNASGKRRRGRGIRETENERARSEPNAPQYLNEEQDCRFVGSRGSSEIVVKKLEDALQAGKGRFFCRASSGFPYVPLRVHFIS